MPYPKVLMDRLAKTLEEICGTDIPEGEDITSMMQGIAAAMQERDCSAELEEFVGLLYPIIYDGDDEDLDDTLDDEMDIHCDECGMSLDDEGNCPVCDEVEMDEDEEVENTPLDEEENDGVCAECDEEEQPLSDDTIQDIEKQVEQESPRQSLMERVRSVIRAIFPQSLENPARQDVHSEAPKAIESSVPLLQGPFYDNTEWDKYMGDTPDTVDKTTLRERLAKIPTPEELDTNLVHDFYQRPGAGGPPAVCGSDPIPPTTHHVEVNGEYDEAATKQMAELHKSPLFGPYKVTPAPGMEEIAKEILSPEVLNMPKEKPLPIVNDEKWNDVVEREPENHCVQEETRSYEAPESPSVDTSSNTSTNDSSYDSGSSDSGSVSSDP